MGATIGDLEAEIKELREELRLVKSFSADYMMAMRTLLGGAIAGSSRLVEPKPKMKNKTDAALAFSESEEEVEADASGLAAGSSPPL